jgi:hypothetical protein
LGKKKGKKKNLAGRGGDRGSMDHLCMVVVNCSTVDARNEAAATCLHMMGWMMKIEENRARRHAIRKRPTSVQSVA